MSNVPEGAQLSEDGQYWWDGENWQQVEGANANENEGNENENNDNTDADAAEVTVNDVTPVNDSGVEPGDETLIDERLKPFFEPDYDGVEDDSSYAEQGEVMDDSQATGGGTNSNENQSNENQSGDNDNQEGN